MEGIKKLDESRDYGTLFVGTKTYFVQDGIRFDPATRAPVAGGKAVEKEKAPEEKKEVEEEKPVAENTCEVCGKVCKSKSGLRLHMRSHKE